MKHKLFKPRISWSQMNQQWYISGAGVSSCGNSPEDAYRNWIFWLFEGMHRLK